MTRAVWDTLLKTARSAHGANLRLTAFCPFPEDITEQPVTAHNVPAVRLFLDETRFGSDASSAFHMALRDAAPHAHWRETYKDTNIGRDFMDRFGCYCLIGPEGPFSSDSMRAWMVYMPPSLNYTWHCHPAEEMYLVLAGSARFFREGDAPEILSKNQLSEHRSNQPHAMETEDSAVLAYVVWRNNFNTPPVLTPNEALA